jgi:hypothetical protein
MSNARTVKLEGFIYEVKFHEGDEPSYSLLFSDDAGDKYYTLIGPVSFEYEIPPDWNPTAAKVAALEKEREEVKAEFARRVADLNERISKLQAITYEPEAA